MQSLGAKFVEIDLGEVGQTEQGYAEELTAEQIELQRDGQKAVIAQSDVVITTAQLFGRAAPVIVGRDMVEAMKPGSVVVDMAVESGGNVEGSVSGEEILVGQVTVWGAKDVASEMPVHASQLYAMNIAALAGLLVKEGEFVVDLEDEVLDGCAVVHDGEVRNEAAQQALQGGA